MRKNVFRMLIPFAISIFLGIPVGGQVLQPGGDVVRGSTLATGITISGSKQASASQTAVLRVQRDIFRNGGWGFRWKDPMPYNDGYNYGEAGIQLRLGDVIPPGSIVTSAVLNWGFNSLYATTDSNRPTPATELGGNHAKAPRVHGSGSYCGPCSPAAMGHWGPDAAHWPNRIQLGGQSLYWFAAPQPRNDSGSVNLLSIYPASALPGNTLTFYGTLQYGVGRPFFATEGWNADTEFDVWGHAQVNVSASVSVTFIPPPPCDPPTITSQPRNTTVLSGHPATLSVSASGCSPFTYQWIAGSAVIPGASSDVYVTPPLTADAAYSVRVSNSAGSVTSNTAFVTVQPVATLSALTLASETTCGTNPASGTVVLTAPAPPGGIPVGLSSSFPGSASVPTILTVPEGSVSANFTITTYPVAITVPVTITANYQSVSKTATLNVGQDLASLALAPTLVCGGIPSRATVTLFCPAPSSGVTLALTSGNPVAVVPNQLGVSPGNTTAEFAVNTTAIPADTDVTLTAELGGVRKTAVLTVTGPTIDITGRTTVTSGGFRFDHASGHFKQIVQIKNESPNALTGPLMFALDGLPQTVSLSNQAGLTSCPVPAGSPFVALTLGSAINLAPGAAATVSLEFTNPNNVPITYGARVLARLQ